MLRSRIAGMPEHWFTEEPGCRGIPSSRDAGASGLPGLSGAAPPRRPWRCRAERGAGGRQRGARGWGGARRGAGRPVLQHRGSDGSGVCAADGGTASRRPPPPPAARPRGGAAAVPIRSGATEGAPILPLRPPRAKLHPPEPPAPQAAGPGGSYPPTLPAPGHRGWMKPRRGLSDTPHPRTPCPHLLLFADS